MYAARFGLGHAPFRLLPDPRFYLDDGQYGTILAQLIEGLEAGQPCLLLTGPAGSGKTAAMQRLLMLLDRTRWTVGTMFASAGAAGEGVLHAAAHAFDLARADAQPGPALDAWLSCQAARGGRLLLVVDEAEHLDDGALRQLAERLVPTRGTPRLQLCLVGEQAPAALAGAVRDGSLPPVVVHCRLRALDATEVRNYVLHRLRCAGWTGRPAFGRDATDAIHRRSEGIPRRIHLIADRVLLQLSLDAVNVATAAAVEIADDRRTVELQGGAPIEAWPAHGVDPPRPRPGSGTHPHGHVQAAQRTETPAAPVQISPDVFRAGSQVAASEGGSLRLPESAIPRDTLSVDTASAGARGTLPAQAAAPRWTAADIRKTAVGAIVGAIVVALAGIGIGWWLGVGGTVPPPAAPRNPGLDSARAAVVAPARRATDEPAASGGGLAEPAGSTPAADLAPVALTALAPSSMPAEPGPIAGSTAPPPPYGAAPSRARAMARPGTGEPLPALPARPGYGRAPSVRSGRDALPAAGLPRDARRAIGSVPADAAPARRPLPATSTLPASPMSATCTRTATALGLCEPAATRSQPASQPARTAAPAADAVSTEPLRAAPPPAPCEPGRAALGLCEL